MNEEVTDFQLYARAKMFFRARHLGFSYQDSARLTMIFLEMYGEE